MRYENFASSWATDFAKPRASQCDCAKKSSCGLLLHGQAPAATPAATTAALTTVRQQAVTRKYGYVFVTDQQMPNPWAGLPSYFAQLMDVIVPVGVPGG